MHFRVLWVVHGSSYCTRYPGKYPNHPEIYYERYITALHHANLRCSFPACSRSPRTRPRATSPARGPPRARSSADARRATPSTPYALSHGHQIIHGRRILRRTSRASACETLPTNRTLLTLEDCIGPECSTIRLFRVLFARTGLLARCSPCCPP